MEKKRVLVLLVVLSLVISMVSIPVVANGAQNIIKMVSEQEMKEEEILEDQNIIVKEKLDEETSDAMDEYESVALETGDAVVESKNVVVETEEVVPESEEVVPGSEEVVPGSEEVVPGSEEVVPGSEEVVPGSEEVVPGSEEVVPGSEEVVPGSEEVVPESQDVVAPEDGIGESENTMGTFATTNAVPYQVAIAYANGSFTLVGNAYTDFGQAKTAMNANSNANAVVLDSRRTPGNGVVAMKNGVVVTTADKVGKSTLVFYFASDPTISTYVENRIDAIYLDSTGSTINMAISGHSVGGISINEVELVPMVQGIQSYYTKNSSGDLIHRVARYSFSSTNNRYTGQYETITICAAPTFMQTNVEYYSMDGEKFYTDKKLTNLAGTFYPYYKYLSFRSKTSYTAAELNSYISSWNKSTSTLNGKGAAFIQAQNDFGVNAALLLSFAIHESAYGTSTIARDKNNLFGVNATDSNPYGNASVYSSIENSIYNQAEYQISRAYTDANKDFRYFGASIGNKRVGLNVKYASDPYWGEKIAGHMYRLDKYLGSKDNNKYQLAISKKVTYAKKEPTSSSANYYKYSVKDYNLPEGMPILITSSNNGWYKVQSDMGIDASGTAPALYNTKYDYCLSKAYVVASDFTIINNPVSLYVDPSIEGTIIEGTSPDIQDKGVIYQTHVQDLGWQGWKANGNTSGTIGKALRLEGINIRLIDVPAGMGISYSTHIQDLGWQDWKSNGKMSGTVGQSKRIEAIKIQLDSAPTGYHIEYRVHIQDYGWQDWKSDGEIAGITGKNKRLEGLEIKLVKNDNVQVTYQTHVQDAGWQNWKEDGGMSGTSGMALRLEGVNIKLVNVPTGTSIKYSTHIQSIGWQDWKSNGAMSGTQGQSKRLEAIKIELVGAQAGYHIEYRVHIQDIGWQSWKRDGNIAGTVGQAKRLEAIEIRVVK